MISINTEDTGFKLKSIRKHKTWIKDIIYQHNMEVGNISYIFCSNHYILNINRKYLNHDYYTDIITFNYNEKNLISGDVFISIDTVRENAIDFKQSFEEELRRVMIHGILHLLGFDDHTPMEKELMRQKEAEALSIYNENLLNN